MRKNKKFGILQKGLIFLLIPLIAQMFFFFQLLQMMEGVQKLAAEQRRLEKAFPIVVNIIIKFGNVWGEIGTGYYDPEDRADAVATYNRKMNQLIEELETLTSDFPKMRAIITATQAMQKHQSDLLGKALEFENPSLENSPALKKELVKSVLIASDIERLIEEQRVELQLRSNKILYEEEQLKTFLVCGVYFDLFLAIFLFWLFLNNISSRLNLLVENASILSKLELLPNKVKGSDELAYLDEVLHETSDELRASADQRRSMLEMMAHDMRAPLTNAQLTLEQLKRDDSPANDKEKMVQRLKGNHGMLISMIDDILTVEEFELGQYRLEYEEFSLSELVEECFEMLSVSASSKEIVLVNTVGDAQILADKKKIFRVVLNLLSNALKFSGPNSRVEVTASWTREELKVFVKDSGPGIPFSMQEKIFDKFFQLSAAKNLGFGLGLAICKQIILCHGGKIGVESEPGKGSWFWFTLPKVD